MKTTEIRTACNCTYCFRRVISATDLYSNQVPLHGDLAICKACGGVSIFDLRLRSRNMLRRPTAEERLAIERNASAIRVRQLQARKGGNHEFAD